MKSQRTFSTYCSDISAYISTINYNNPKLYPKIPEETACLICLSEDEDFYINYNCYDKHNHIYCIDCLKKFKNKNCLICHKDRNNFNIFVCYGDKELKIKVGS